MDVETKKVHEYGIDLMRIFSTLLITVLHTIEAGEVLENTPPLSIRFYIISAIRIACLCSVNCYALISGYVGYDKKFKILRIVKLWLQLELWFITIYADIK